MKTRFLPFSPRATGTTDSIDFRISYWTITTASYYDTCRYDPSTVYASVRVRNALLFFTTALITYYACSFLFLSSLTTRRDDFVKKRVSQVAIPKCWKCHTDNSDTYGNKTRANVVMSFEGLCVVRFEKS